MADDFNAATEHLSAGVFMIAIDRAVESGADPNSDQIVVMRRLGVAMAAAEALAAEVEHARGEVPRSLTDAAALFRKAMRGER